MKDSKQDRRRQGLQSVEIDVLKIWRRLKADRPLLLAVSGGLDSMVLLTVFKALQSRLQVPIAVGHFHHGRIKSVQGKYRDESRELVKRECAKAGLRFFSQSGPTGAAASRRSEAEARRLRYAALRSMADDWVAEADLGSRPFLVLAHHADDLLETRLMRLIRGAGPAGLTAMQVCTEDRFRPFLPMPRLRLVEYARRQSVPFIDDPSNTDLRVFRNWMRHHWLKDLEQRQPGACKALSRSLELVAEYSGEPTPVGGDSVDLQDWATIPDSEKRRRLHSYIVGLGLKNFSQRHVDEILKRLDKSRRRTSFTLLKSNWVIESLRLRASPARR